MKEKLRKVRDKREAWSDQSATQSTKERECVCIYSAKLLTDISDMFIYDPSVKSFQALASV